MRNLLVTIILLALGIKCQAQQHMINKPDTTVRTFKIIDDMVDAWDAIFEKDRPKVVENAFDIKASIDYNEAKGIKSPSVNLSLANRDIPKVDEPAPVFEKKDMTMKFENGKLVPIEKQGQMAIKAFGITMDEDELIDSIFNSKTTIIFKGEVYTKLTKKEMEEMETKKVARVKKPKGSFKPENADISNVFDFIDEYEDEGMNTQRLYAVPYPITMAQAILESRHGTSKMARKSNNLFGIKCNGGKCRKHDCPHDYYTDDEEGETFERHASYAASFNRHAEFLKMYDRYDRCFRCGDDIGCWARNLDIAGYATEKDYGRSLIAIINKYQLADYKVSYPKRK